MTSQLIFRRGRLGRRLSFNSNKICNFRLQKRRCHRKDTLCASGDEPLSGRVFLSLLGGIPVVQESQVNILVVLIYLFDNFYSCFWLAISLRPIRRGGHMLKTIFIHKLLVWNLRGAMPKIWLQRGGQPKNVVCKGGGSPKKLPLSLVVTASAIMQASVPECQKKPF